MKLKAKRAIHAIIGNKCNLSQPLRTTFFSSNSSISYIDAFRLSRALGTKRFIYMRGIRVTRFSNLKNKGMTLPTEGNKYFKGYGNGLPTGGPEVIIPAQPTRPWSSHQ